MKHLKELHEKLDEHNRAENEAWMILIDITRPDFVFIVHADDINKAPSWWPIADTAETIYKALELVPKEEKFKVEVYNALGNKGWSAHVNQDTKDQILKLMRGS